MLNSSPDLIPVVHFIGWEEEEVVKIGPGSDVLEPYCNTWRSPGYVSALR
jgi:hypothetical protein